MTREWSRRDINNYFCTEKYFFRTDFRLTKSRVQSHVGRLFIESGSTAPPQLGSCGAFIILSITLLLLLTSLLHRYKCFSNLAFRILIKYSCMCDNCAFSKVTYFFFTHSCLYRLKVKAYHFVFNIFIFFFDHANICGNESHEFLKQQNTSWVIRCKRIINLLLKPSAPTPFIPVKHIVGKKIKEAKDNWSKRQVQKWLTNRALNNHAEMFWSKRALEKQISTLANFSPGVYLLNTFKSCKNRIRNALESLIE